MLVGFYACARCEDLSMMKWSDFSYCDQGIKFIVQGEKTQSMRENRAPTNSKMHWALDQYSIAIQRLRDAISCLIDRAFLKYQNGSLCNQAIGKNTLSLIPREVAIFLMLDNMLMISVATQYVDLLRLSELRMG